MLSYRHAAPSLETVPAPPAHEAPSFASDLEAPAFGPVGPAFGTDALSLAAGEWTAEGDMSWAADVEGDEAREGLAVAVRVLQDEMASGQAPPPWDAAVDALLAAVTGRNLDPLRSAVALFDPALDLADPAWVADVWRPLVDRRCAEMSRREAGVRTETGDADPTAQLATIGAVAARLGGLGAQLDVAFSATDFSSKLVALVGSQADFAGCDSLAAFGSAVNAVVKMHAAHESGTPGSPLISAVELGNLVSAVGVLALDGAEQLARIGAPERLAEVSAAIGPLKKVAGYAGPALGFLGIATAIIQVGEAKTPDERNDAWVGLIGNCIEVAAACLQAGGATALAGVLSGAALSIALTWFVFKASVLQMGRTTWAITAGFVVSHLETVHGAALELLTEADEVARARSMADLEQDPVRAEGLRAHAAAQGTVLSRAAAATNQSLQDGRAGSGLVPVLRPSLNEVIALANQGAPIEALVAAVTRFTAALSAAMADPAPIVTAIVGYGPETSTAQEIA